MERRETLDNAALALAAGAGGNIMHDVLHRLEHIEQSSVRYDLAEVVEKLVVCVSLTYLLINGSPHSIGDIFAYRTEIFVCDKRLDEIWQKRTFAREIYEHGFPAETLVKTPPVVEDDKSGVGIEIRPRLDDRPDACVLSLRAAAQPSIFAADNIRVKLTYLHKLLSP